MKTEICCCRICKNMNITEFNSKHIFSDENYEIIENLKLSANIQLDKNDELPKFICEDCEFDLNLAINFRFKCEKVDAELRELQQSNTKLVFETEVVYENENNFNDLYNDIFDTNNYMKFEEDAAYAEFIDNQDDDQEPNMEIETPIKIEIDQYISEDNVSNSWSDALSTTKTEENIIEKKSVEKKSNKIGRFVCDTCQFTTDIYVDYCLHIKIHGNNRYGCTQCSRWFKTKWGLNYHLNNTHERINTCVCEHCGQVLSNAINLQRHVSNQHFKERPYKCQHCEKSFGRSDNLRGHIETVHNDVRNYCCGVENCKKSFKTKRLLELHKSRMHDLYIKNSKGPIQNIPCPQCNKLFSSNAKLKYHLRWHNGERPFVCKKCDKTFPFKNSLIVHNLMHNNLRPFKCNLCDASFRQAPHLKSHMVTHTGEKNYKCDLCNKSFGLKSYLNEHIKIHLGTNKKRIRIKKSKQKC